MLESWGKNLTIDYAHICSKFLEINNLKLKSNSVVQQKKFCNTLKEKRSTQNPEKKLCRLPSTI